MKFEESQLDFDFVNKWSDLLKLDEHIDFIKFQ